MVLSPWRAVAACRLVLIAIGLPVGSRSTRTYGRCSLPDAKERRAGRCSLGSQRGSAEFRASCAPRRSRRLWRGPPNARRHGCGPATRSREEVRMLRRLIRECLDMAQEFDRRARTRAFCDLDGRPLGLYTSTHSKRNIVHGCRGVVLARPNSFRPYLVGRYVGQAANETVAPAISTEYASILAEGMRFELTDGVDPHQRFSKPPPSATRPPLRGNPRPFSRSGPDKALARDVVGEASSQRQTGIDRSVASTTASLLGNLVGVIFPPGQRAIKHAIHTNRRSTRLACNSESLMDVIPCLPGGGSPEGPIG